MAMIQPMSLAPGSDRTPKREAAQQPFPEPTATLPCHTPPANNINDLHAQIGLLDGTKSATEDMIARIRRLEALTTVSPGRSAVESTTQMVQTLSRTVHGMIARLHEGIEKLCDQKDVFFKEHTSIGPEWYRYCHIFRKRLCFVPPSGSCEQALE